MSKKIRPPVKTHGGKHYLKNFIIENFPENYEELIYCEPLCGGASVLLNKNKSKQEIISDLDKGLISIFKALRDEPQEFIERIKKIKYTEKSFNLAKEAEDGEFEDYIALAVNEYTLRRMSRGGMRKSFAWSERQRGGKPGDVNAWETMTEELVNISERVKDAIILNENFFDLFKIWDEEDTLWYIDPPYLPSTRNESAVSVYKYEMTVEDHINLLQVIKNCRGKIVLSGYSSPVYNRALKGWKCKKKDVPNNSSQTKTKDRRLECIWMNYD